MPNESILDVVDVGTQLGEECFSVNRVGLVERESIDFVVFVNICSFQGHCYCRRRPIALFDDYCGSRPPLLRIKATGC